MKFGEHMTVASSLILSRDRNHGPHDSPNDRLFGSADTPFVAELVVVYFTPIKNIVGFAYERVPAEPFFSV